MEKTSADENCIASSILFLVASSEETSWVAGGVVEGPRLAVALSRGAASCCGVVEGPHRLACCGAGPVCVVCKSS
jgi:hypothetical protein